MRTPSLNKMAAELEGSPIAQRALQLYMDVLGCEPTDPTAKRDMAVADGLVKLLNSKKNLHEGASVDDGRKNELMEKLKDLA